MTLLLLCYFTITVTCCVMTSLCSSFTVKQEMNPIQKDGSVRTTFFTAIHLALLLNIADECSAGCFHPFTAEQVGLSLEVKKKHQQGAIITVRISLFIFCDMTNFNFLSFASSD